MSYKTYVRRIFHRLGYDISHYDVNEPGKNPFLDMQRFVADDPNTTIFDVGANVGQTIERFRLHYRDAHIHSFEPSPKTFQKLRSAVGSRRGVSTWNFAVGSSPGRAVLQENKESVMTSLLDLGEQGWGAVENRTEVEVKTLDDFCREQKIAQVDILKSDAQGFDLEVMRGAEQMMQANRVGLVLCELCFVEYYRNMATFDAVYRHLLDRSFAVGAFYPIHYTRNIAQFIDVLFVNKAMFPKHFS